MATDRWFQMSKRCRAFILSHWGKDGLKQVRERPVSWVRYEANPHVKALRRQRKHLPLITVQGRLQSVGVNRISLALSTEKTVHA